MQKIASFFSPYYSRAQNLSSEFTQKLPSSAVLLEKIVNVVKVIFKAAVSIFLYWTNPSLFAIGFIAGIIFDDHVEFAIQKIKNIWKSQPWSFSLLGGFASALSLPVTLATGSFLWAANWGSVMSREATRILKAQVGFKWDPSADETTETLLSRAIG